ncbi:MAG: ribonuclease J [Bacillota bacterium]|nr:ribonuclease J [Bacillota bacterium]
MRNNTKQNNTKANTTKKNTKGKSGRMTAKGCADKATPVSSRKHTDRKGAAKRAARSEKNIRGEKPSRTDRPVRSEKKGRPDQRRNRRPASPVRVIPLGGLHEIGKNMTAIEYEEEILLIDCGLSFPDDEMFGIDKVIPDFTYLTETDKKILGLVITHGHEDHIGAVPYLLKEINVPVYGMRFPLGLIRNKLEEHHLKVDMHPIGAGETFSMGRHFRLEALRITHSIADSICLRIETPAGVIFHTGDFKIDYTPVDGNKIDFGRLARIGTEGVLLMMADSTNVMRQGYTRSEMKVGEALDPIFRSSRGRIIIATFSSNVHRIQRIIDIAVRCHRKVAISGRSMVNVFELAKEMGYITIPEHMLVDLDQTKNIPDHELVIITTGSQGEPMSALARMASMEHRTIHIKKGDMVILSSTPVPGNELTVSNVVDQLIEKGAEVIYSDIAETHVSGHACREELKLMHSLIHPKYFMPVHGEYRHLQKHAQLAEYLGLQRDHIFLLSNGDGLTLTAQKAEIQKQAAPADDIMVDGLGVGDVGNMVLKDRRLLSESGLIIVVATIDCRKREIVSGPEVITRGFVYVRDNEDLIEETGFEAELILEECLHKNRKDLNAMKTSVREGLRKFLYQKTRRNPVILPVFMEV